MLFGALCEGQKKKCFFSSFSFLIVGIPRPASPVPELKEKSSEIKKFFSGGRKSDPSIDHGKPQLPDRVPSLSQMRRFASSRGKFANFDWTTSQIAPEEDRYFYSDEDRDYSDGEDDVIILFSSPILVAGAREGVGDGLNLEPRKEINLWKRRIKAQPKPLQLNVVSFHDQELVQRW